MWKELAAKLGKFVPEWKIFGKGAAEIDAKLAEKAAKMGAEGADAAKVEPTMGKPPRMTPEETKAFLEKSAKETAAKKEAAAQAEKAAKDAQAAKDAEAAKKADDTKKAEYKAAEPEAGAAGAAPKGNGKYVPPTRGLSWWSEFKLTYKDTSLEKIPLFGRLLKDGEPASLARDLETADRVRFGGKTAEEVKKAQSKMSAEELKKAQEEGQRAVDKLSDKIIAKYRDQKTVTQKINGKAGETETSYGINGNDRSLVRTSDGISPQVQAKVNKISDRVYDVDTSWMTRWGEHHVGSPINFIANYPVLGTMKYAGDGLKLAGQTALAPITLPIKAIKWGTSNPVLAAGAIVPLGLYERSVDYKHAAPIGTGAAALYSAYGAGAMKLASGGLHYGGELVGLVSPDLGKSMLDGSKDVAKYSVEGLAFASVFAAKTATAVTGKTVNPEDLLHYVPSVLIENPAAKVGLAALKGATEPDEPVKTQTATQETDKDKNMGLGTTALGAGVKAGVRKLEEHTKGANKPEIDPATGEPAPAPAPVDNKSADNKPADKPADDKKTDEQIEQQLNEEEKTRFGKLDIAGKKKLLDEKREQLAELAKKGLHGAQDKAKDAINAAEDFIDEGKLNELKKLPVAGLFGALMGFDKNKGLGKSLPSMLALGTIFALIWDKIGGSVMGFFAPGGRSTYDSHNRQMAMGQRYYRDQQYSMNGAHFTPGGVIPNVGMPQFSSRGVLPVGELRPVGGQPRFAAGGVVPVGELRPVNPSISAAQQVSQTPIQTQVDPKAAADQAAYEAMMQKIAADKQWADNKVNEVVQVNGIERNYPAGPVRAPADTKPVVEVNGIERSYGGENQNIDNDTRQRALKATQPQVPLRTFEMSGS